MILCTKVRPSPGNKSVLVLSEPDLKRPAQEELHEMDIDLRDADVHCKDTPGLNSVTEYPALRPPHWWAVWLRQVHHRQACCLLPGHGRRGITLAGWM